MPTFLQDPLLASLLRPETMAGLSLRDWDNLLPRARAASLLPRVAVLAERGGLLAALPEPVRRHLITGIALARNQDRVLRWELQRLQQTLRPLECPVLLLKGAAYVAAGLPLADARMVSDIDVMVPFEALGRVEEKLLSAGWEHPEQDPYDRRYYLEWMHELPPLRHRERLTVLDVHHAILPPTGRLKPDPALLWAAARRLPNSPFLVLSDPDMMLHGAAHLFQDGDLHLRLRDLYDIHEMAGAFGRDSFWTKLPARAAALHLERPLYYALRYCQRLFGTDVPAATRAGMRSMAPPAPARAVMDRLVPPTILPPVGNPTLARDSAVRFLYARSHWLRMPPLLLAAHLARKSLRRRR